MPAYKFEALDAAGKSKTGLLEADNAKAARSQLRAQALVPIDVTLVASASTEATLADLRSRMQRSLDELGRSLGHPDTALTYPNPFR